jgi:glycosyltransferase involved in cell wall biosynthesis
VAALVDYKRVELTIKACAKLGGTKLIVVGSGNEAKKAEIKKLGQELMGDRFTLTDSTYDQLPAIYHKADIFTLVSESQEAFGRVYLEAMACNLPIVATDDNQRREIIGDAGLYVKKPQEINAYYQVLQTALKTDFGNKPLEQAQKFSWDEIKKDYLDLFTKLTND